MTTIFGRAMTYGDRKTLMESHDPLTMHSCEVTWKIYNITSPLLQGTWSPTLAGWWLWVKGLHPKDHIIIESGSHITNQKLKTENCFVFNKNWNSRLLEGAIFFIFRPKFENTFFSITNSGYIAIKSRGLFYKKIIAFFTFYLYSTTEIIKYL